MKHRMTRDNFDAALVLQAMATGEYITGDELRLLEEACHRIVRLEYEVNNARSLAKRIVAETSN